MIANGEYLVVERDRVRLLQVSDGKEKAGIETWPEVVGCFAVSRDGRFIAMGTNSSSVFMWNTETLAYRKVATCTDKRGLVIFAVDFSSDSSRLVVGTKDDTAFIFDIATGNQVQTLQHEGSVVAAKYSPYGDRIATGTYISVHIWDSDGCLLVNIDNGVSTRNNIGFLWFDNHLFVLTRNTVLELDASSGSLVSEWPVPGSSDSCISISQHGEFIAHSCLHIVTFWDTSTHAQLGLIQRPHSISAIAHSLDDQFLMICGRYGKITINDLSRITVSISFFWIIPYLNNWLFRPFFRIGFNPFVSTTPCFQGI